MTTWQKIKHAFGFHGKDAEWLDGRMFVDGSYLRTYYCHDCQSLFYEGNTGQDARQFRMTLTQLRAERDAAREHMKSEIDKLTYPQKMRHYQLSQLTKR